LPPTIDVFSYAVLCLILATDRQPDLPPTEGIQIEKT
jgi:hypothetical protein